MKSFKRFMRAALILLVVLGMMIPTALGVGSDAETNDPETVETGDSNTPTEPTEPKDPETPEEPGETPDDPEEKPSETPARTNTLTLSFAPNKQPAAEVTFSLYLVAHVDAKNAQYQAVEGYAAALERTGKQTWADKVETVEAYAKTQEPTVTGSTDKDGKVTFTGLEDGIYLIRATRSVEVDGLSYTPASTLLTLPAYKAGYGWSERNVESDVKTVAKKALAVFITWDDDKNSAKKRPDSVVIELVRDGKVIHTQEVKAGENWSHIWEVDVNDPLIARIRDDSRTILLAGDYTKESIENYTTDNVPRRNLPTTNYYFVLTRGEDIKDPDVPTGNHETYSDLRVLKVWEGDGDGEDRPDSITVDLLRDGKVYDTVELSSATNWRYDWSKLNDKYEWDIVEHVESGYAVTITTDGVTKTITNSFSTDLTDEEPPLTDLDDPDVPLDPGPPEEVEPGDPDIPFYPGDPDIPMIPASPDDPTTDIPDENPPLVELPQTGVLWWPVPIMAVLGAALMLMGYARRRNAVR